ncbi:MAG: alpha-ketoglutarate-dependent dioxygenase AlkB family protein [Tenacibaculum sp.]
MDLFNPIDNYPVNILPKDGTVLYYGLMLSKKEADFYFKYLLNNIAWKNDEAVIFGKHIITKRKVAWYADNAFSYSYSNINKIALPFNSELKRLKKMVEEQTGESYNSCLLNLYHSGEEAMGWHSDAEKSLKRNGAIASLSFGAERKFSFKHKQSKQVVSLALPHGSLLVMKDKTQTYWLHGLAPSKKITKARINLTFRTIIED